MHCIVLHCIVLRLLAMLCHCLPSDSIIVGTLLLMLQLHVHSVPYSALDCENEASYTYYSTKTNSIASEQCQFVGMCRPWQHLSFPTTATSSSTVLLVVIQSHMFATILNLWLQLWSADCMDACSIIKTTHSTSQVHMIKSSKLSSRFSGYEANNVMKLTLSHCHALENLVVQTNLSIIDVYSY